MSNIKELKDYRIEVKVKNNVLYKLMLSKGIESVAELGRLSRVSLPRLYQYMNLKTIPYQEHRIEEDVGTFQNSFAAERTFLNVSSSGRASHTFFLNFDRG